MQKKILIAGGGLAGLTAAIHLSRQGFDVTIIEKNSYPHHKVCGEYISNEVLPYLDWLDANPLLHLDASNITHLEFSTASGKKINTQLPLGGFGISRFLLDEFLYNKAIQQGCKLIQDNITDISYNNDGFEVITSSGQNYAVAIVLGAFGKRSNLDIKLERNFINKKSPWLAVKQHYKGNFPDDMVGLYCFMGGYCGVSKVEDDTLNICYLTDFASFKKYKDIDEHRKKVLYKNPVLKEIFEQSTPIFDKPVTISQISFEDKKTVEDHIIMIGDTAGLINPLCGNGMAMAIHSAQLASDLITAFLQNEITRTEMEQQYTLQWNEHFMTRITMGKRIAKLLQQQRLTPLATMAFSIFPGLLKMIINKTHGHPIKVNAAHEYNA
jgi:flavin-dependent dehydrogenase